MILVALKGLLQRKLRALLTAMAVVLGVAMISGTFMLTDSIEEAFDSIFDSSYAQTDAVISGKPLVEHSSSGNPIVPEALLDRVRALPGVAAAAGSIADLQNDSNVAQVLDKDGTIIGGAGAASIGLGIDPDEPRFNPLKLTGGDWARDSGEVVIDAATARSHGFDVGDDIDVIAKGPAQRFQVAGIATYGDVESLGGATIAVFDLPTAQRLFGKDGFDSISVAAREGTSAEAVIAQIRPLLGPAARVQSGAASAAADSKEVSTFISYLRYALLAFGGIALFVGGFVIFNTLSITVAQRTREFATLRTLGASRRQVMRSVIVETIAIGLVASLAGLALGLGLSRGLSFAFGELGLSMPQAGTVVAARTVIISLAVGVFITLVAGIVPAIRATRIPPIQAVGEGAVAQPSRLAPRAGWISAFVLAMGAGILAYGLLGPDVPVQGRLAAIGGGALAVFIGVAMLAPRLVPALAAVVGWPAQRMGGAAGELARRNAVRNPARTAATAAALMIGLTLVTTVAVLGQGLRASATSTIERQIAADYVVTSGSGDTLPPQVGREVASLPGVEASSVRSDEAKVLGATATVTGVDPETIGAVYRFRFSDGSDAAVDALANGGAIARQSFADKHHLVIGERTRITSPSGRTLDVRVAGIIDPGKFDLDPLLGSLIVSQLAFDGAFPRAGDRYTFVNVPEEAGTFAARGIAEAEKRYPGIQIDTRDAFVASRVAPIEQILNLLYVLLALSVVVSLFGMVNTLVLAVFERTRELGMLRAIGLTRRQTRRMVRHESVITALIGAALGLPLGLGLAVAVTQALSGYDVQLSVPAGTLAVFVAVAVAAGIVAAIMPARRAGRLDVLEALQYQ